MINIPIVDVGHPHDAHAGGLLLQGGQEPVRLGADDDGRPQPGAHGGDERAQDTKGGICLWDGENLISGDTIFAGGGVGRTDIGGNWNDLKKSVSKLMKLDVLNIYPGHGPVVEGNGNQHLLLSYSMF